MSAPTTFMDLVLLAGAIGLAGIAMLLLLIVANRPRSHARLRRRVTRRAH